MSILIKGMEMPKNCFECPLNYDSIDCMVADIELREKGGGDFLYEHERASKCPLVLVPPHGALMDRDEFFAACPELVDGYKQITDDLVVIEAEEGESC